MDFYQTLFICFAFTCGLVSGQDPIVNIISTDPQVHPVYKQIVQEKDKDVQLTCTVEHRPRGRSVLWTMEKLDGSSSPVSLSEATKSLDAFRWAIDTPFSTAWRLRIQNAQVSDEGIYTCKVQTVSLSYVEDRRELRIVQSPQISDLTTSSDMTKEEGEDASLECYATGRPEPLIKWTRMAGELLPNGGNEFQGNVLNIDSLHSDHSGIYKCTAENSAGSDERELRLTIRYPPVVTTGQNVVYQMEGYVKELVCNIKGYPAPTVDQISWMHEGRPVISDGRIEVRNIPGASNRITSIVIFNGVRTEDFGMYRCAASNSKGRGSRDISLERSQVPTSDRSGEIRNAGHRLTPASSPLAAVFMCVVVCLLRR